MSAGKPMIEMTRDLFDEMLISVARKERQYILDKLRDEVADGSDELMAGLERAIEVVIRAGQ